jgi:hypothetical protein
MNNYYDVKVITMLFIIIKKIEFTNVIIILISINFFYYLNNYFILKMRSHEECSLYL